MPSKLSILVLLLALGLGVRADDATTNAPADATPPSAEKAAATELVQELKAMDAADSLGQDQWAALDAKIDAYDKQYGVTPQTTKNMVLLRRYELKVASDFQNDERYQTLVKKIAADSRPEVAALTTQLASLMTTPLNLKFTAVDGSAVDFAALRGKVVLLDFWATWCPPCREEVPNVVAAYKKYHGQGFEVVGISLDQDQQALQDFTTQNGMTWPQYFDGQGWKNAISSSYNIHSIPTMWLFDRKGLLISFSAGDDLDNKLAKALAAP